MRNVVDESFRDNQNTHTVQSITFFPPKILIFMRHLKEHGRGGQATGDNLLRMRIVCWITKTRLQTHTENI